MPRIGAIAFKTVLRNRFICSLRFLECVSNCPNVIEYLRMDGSRREKNLAYVLKSFFRALTREQRQHFRGVKRHSPFSQGIVLFDEGMEKKNVKGYTLDCKERRKVRFTTVTYSSQKREERNGMLMKIKISGILSNDDGDVNDNGKKATLHVHHAFLYISLPSLHDYRTT